MVEPINVNNWRQMLNDAGLDFTKQEDISLFQAALEEYKTYNDGFIGDKEIRQVFNIANRMREVRDAR